MNWEIINLRVFLLVLVWVWFNAHNPNNKNANSLLTELPGRTIKIPLCDKKIKIRADINFARRILEQNRLYIIECAQKADISPRLLAAVIYCESYFNPPELQSLEKILVFLGAQIAFPPNLSVGPAQIQIETAFSFLNLLQKPRRLNHMRFLSKRTTAILLIDDKANIAVCALLLKVYKSHVLLSAESPPSRQKLVEHSAALYNAGIDADIDGHIVYGHLVYMLSEYEPFIQKLFPPAADFF
jgi:hypothetical protein